MKLSIFGTGYVGLVQAAVFAETGHNVLCVDIDDAKVANLRRGVVTIFEPGLERLVRENSDSGRLKFTANPAEGVAHADVAFIAVGTPPDEDGSADLSHVLAVVDAIGRNMDRHKTIVVKSTVPVGTGDRVRQRLAELLATRGYPHLTFDVVSNPEFLKEGSAVADCMKPDRIILGASSQRAELLLREVYAPFNRNHEKIIAMDIRSAELTKYAANCLLATKISFINEIANLADQLGADIERVRQGIGSDPRIGFHFIYPGIGFGGSCFPKDVRALIKTSEQIGLDPMVLRAVEMRNQTQKNIMISKMLDHYGGEVQGRTFALWGLAFKPNTDDMREAPSRVILEELWKRGARFRVFDPKAMDECHRLYGARPDLVLCRTQEEALTDADALVIATEWRSFQSVSFDELAAGLREKVVFDGRNILSPTVARASGFTYYGIGRGSDRVGPGTSREP